MVGDNRHGPMKRLQATANWKQYPTEGAIMPADHQDRLLSVQELASYLGVSLFTVYRWNSDGVGPVRLRVRGRVLYREPDVQAWLARHEVSLAEREAER